MDLHTAHLLKKSVTISIAKQQELRFQFYSILVVYVWSLFETYIGMVLEELYGKCPALLRSSQTLSYEQALDHLHDLPEFLIAQQLAVLGNYNLKDTLRYLSTRLNLAFTPAAEASLAEYYLFRNIVAHDSGLLRPGQSVPRVAGVSVSQGEIQFTKMYLLGMLNGISRAVRQAEQHIGRKFY